MSKFNKMYNEIINSSVDRALKTWRDNLSKADESDSHLFATQSFMVNDLQAPRVGTLNREWNPNWSGGHSASTTHLVGRDAYAKPLASGMIFTGDDNDHIRLRREDWCRNELPKPILIPKPVVVESPDPRTIRGNCESCGWHEGVKIWHRPPGYDGPRRMCQACIKGLFSCLDERRALEKISAVRSKWKKVILRVVQWTIAIAAVYCLL